MSTASSAAAGPPPGMAVRLSSNESPFGPSPAAVAAAAQQAEDAHRYPDDQSVELRRAIAEHEGRPIDQVAVGTGSAALLMDAIAHLASGGEVVAFAHSFVVYRLGAANAGARYVEVGADATGPAGSGGRDVDALLSAIGTETRVVCVDNPGNPTGAHLTGTQLRELIAALPEHVTPIVDEAYHHFATGQRGYATVAELGIDDPRVLVTRTFSKAYALAGLRVGSLLGPPELIGPIDARRPRFNVTAPAQRAAVASLADADHLERTIAGTLDGRARMATALRDLGVPFADGLGNFLTIELGTDAAPVVDAYAARGIGVRALAPYGMHQQIRVTVGTPAEVDAFLAASQEVLAGVPSRA